MQHQRRKARALAVLAAGAMVLASLLALRHETLVAHVRDRVTGAVHHAQALAELHEQGQGAHAPQHLHGLDVDHHPDTGSCPLHQGLAATTILPSAPHLAATPHVTTDTVTASNALTPVAQAIYRLAPKTSPPARALV
jgi:hypothetical protein